MKKILNSRAGISLIETVIALLILSVMGVAIVGVTLQIMGASNAAFLRNQATVTGEAGLEQARGYYQTNLFQSLLGKASCGTCYADGNLGTCNVTCITPTGTCGSQGSQVGTSGIYRSVSVTGSGSQATVTSNVAWTDRGTCQKATFSTDFYSY